MRSVFFLLLVTALSHPCRSQTISYDIPEGYEKDIQPSDYKLIVDSSVAIIATRYKVESVKAGAIQLAPGQELRVLNLHNLITKCTAEKNRSDWGYIIRGHFTNIFASLDQQKKIDPSKYESVKKYLSIRIYPKEYIEQRGGPQPFIAKTDLEGTWTMLMFDLPGSFSPVPKAAFQRWNKDTAEVFAAALANVDSQKIEKSTQTIDFRGNKLEMTVLGNDDYAASYALDLQNNSPELVGEWGCAIAIPNKGLVNLCKISHDKPVDFVNFIQLTRAFIEKSYQEHPQPISDQFFWYYKGKFTLIHVLVDAKGAVNVISPFGLTELMTQKQ